MLVEPSDTVLVLPAVTRYESPGGGTETTTERRIIFSPEIPGRRIGTARPEWWAITEAAARAYPGRATLIRFADAAAIRAEIARAIPLYAGIETLAAKGDQVQWGGRLLYEHGQFATPDRKAHFAPIVPRGRRREPDAFYVSTRRGKQFNSMIQKSTRPVDRRRSRRHPDERRGRGPPRSGRRRCRPPEVAARAYEGQVQRAAMRPGNMAVHWPEGNVLLGPAVDPDSMEPDYNAVVTVESLGERDAAMR